MSIFKDEQSKNTYDRRRKTYFSEIEQLLSDYNIDLETQTKNLATFQRRIDFPKQLAIYELFKKTKEIPGSILDFGVYRGGSFLIFCHLMETFFPGERSKKVFGFDNFKGYFQAMNKEVETEPQGLEDPLRGQMLSDTDLGYMRRLLDIHENDGFLPGVPRGELVDGDICETLPVFLSQNPAMRFSYINVDVNLYDPVMCILENTWDRLIRGGIIAFSGYPNEPWAGESQAVDEFFTRRSVCEKFQILGWSTYPRSFLSKQ